MPNVLFSTASKGSQIKGAENVSGLSVQQQRLGYLSRSQNREGIRSALIATYLQFEQ